MEAPKDRISDEKVIQQLLKNGDDGVSNPGGLQPPAHRVVESVLDSSRAAPAVGNELG